MAGKKATFEITTLTREYKYSQEISQMMFVFGEVQDPNMETVNLVEDIVRGQIIELIVQARGLATRRGARYLSAEDLIFLIRHDRGKVNRLRTYLSWKDVRKHAKDSGGDGGGGVEVEALEDGGDEKLTAKAQKITIKLPWEITTIYSEVLKQSGHQSDDEEDEDDIEAHEASVLRLKEADDATRQMTREEYQHYSDCRQASFTYRKAKRFREFLNLPTHLDLKAGDDTVDIVGFLAFEMVRSLTLAGLAIKKSLEEDSHLREEYASPLLGKRKALGVMGGAEKRRREDSPDRDAETSLPVNTLFLPPPEARTALRPEHIQDAFSRMQNEWAHSLLFNHHDSKRFWRSSLNCRDPPFHCPRVRYNGETSMSYQQPTPMAGHQKKSPPEPNYSGTWGDYASFVAHMKRIAEEMDVDLLLVDSGDMHDGTGLSDGFPPGGVDAQDSGEFFKQMPYDVLAIGNHELYKYANTFDMHTNFGRHFQDRYLSSNVNITVFDESGKPVSLPVGKRFRKFKTRKGKSITAFGVLYDFTTNDVNTTVQPVESLIREKWFLDAITEEPDVFLLVGHMTISSYGWGLVFDTIRERHPTTPILIFGGHLHIRDCLQFDERSMSLASGRYMETIGWMSVDFDEAGTGPLNFSRRYLDANPTTYKYHTGKSDDTFFTEQGKNITDGLHQLEKRFDLTYQYGVSPRDFTMTRDQYPSKGSLLSLTAEEVVPLAISLDTSRTNIPFILIISSGSQRFDIFKGPLTKNDQLTASPFVNRYIYIPDVPYAAATKVLPTLNADGPERIWVDSEKMSSPEELRQRRIRELESNVERSYRGWLEDMHQRKATTLSELTLGYVTADSCPGVGDDVEHTPLPVYPIPSFIASRTPDPIHTHVDLVFDDFFRDQILKTLNKVQSSRIYAVEDVADYTDVLSNEVLGIYAQHVWN
ncbi:hypothetical protein MIND_00794200 [Mycena indigotica]|uniref:Calcineurin-like phosphoesterase domain-containing protein n=1 Tax=Mycena indigotica TaxID=2126181 RepID=A0A8H6SMT5_9AGAR|nr:uncharacterized protein MIND_00794200 [Mycena indigotica]KAF7302271.1 hypothetical protein MIND_00794200 [Mycena indigotica]